MIKILTTGGTIEGLDYNEDGGIIESNVSLKNLLNKANIDVPYSILNIVKKDSRVISDDDRILISEAIAETKESKILITHGTYTMADTAKFLGRLSFDKTIVLVGSFILGSDPNTDAPSNLAFAIESLLKTKNGVYIAMNNSVFNWDNVQKNNKKGIFEYENE